jgi:AcrR family transcriptional regulator
MEKPKKNEKYLCLMSAGKELFFKHGIRRVTVDEICEKANVSKMSFYKFFKNKNELAKEIMLETFNAKLSFYNDTMARDIPFIDKMMALIDDDINQSDMPNNELVEEIMHSNDELREFFNEKMTEYQDLFDDFFETGKREGVFRKSYSMGFISYIIEHVKKMMYDERLMLIMPDFRERHEALTNWFYYGLIDRGSNSNKGK